MQIRLWRILLNKLLVTYNIIILFSFIQTTNSITLHVLPWLLYCCARAFAVTKNDGIASGRLLCSKQVNTSSYYSNLCMPNQINGWYIEVAVLQRAGIAKVYCSSKTVHKVT